MSIREINLVGKCIGSKLLVAKCTVHRAPSQSITIPSEDTLAKNTRAPRRCKNTILIKKKLKTYKQAHARLLKKMS